MKNWIKGGVFFLCLYILFLLIKLPAATAYQFFSKSIIPVQLYRVSGSIWNGNAYLLAINQFQFKGLEWNLEPLKLITGKLAANLDLKDNNYPLRGKISVSFGSSIQLSGLKGKLPAAIIPSIARKPDFNLKGDLDISMDILALEQNKIQQAKGRITLRSASINLPGAINIGNLQADIDTRGNNIIVQLKDLAAPIGLKGSITLKKDQTYTGNLIFTPTSQSDAGVINLLRNTGNSLQNGSIELRFNGKL